jgi:hypothetical protein
VGRRSYPYAFHVALDGSGLNGLEGRAGVCIFRYDPAEQSYAHKISYFPGAAGGHAVSVSPARTIGFLGNTGQHLLFYDPVSLEEADRISTMRFEVTDHSLKASTHLVWLDDVQFITAIGEHFWKFDVNRLNKAERIAPHQLKLPHAMKTTASGRYVVYGGMDHPDRGEAREVGILDLVTGESRRLSLPTTCWHVAAHPSEDLFYALSFRVLPQEGSNWHEWGMAYFKEYVYEIDAETGEVVRHWAAGREVPAHINSDVTMSDSELIFCAGGSQSVVFIDLESFADFRVLDERPDLATQLRHTRAAATQVADSLTRGSPIPSSKHYAAALRVSRGSLLDSVYACQLSADQSLLFTANRGLNCITVYDYPSLTVRLSVQMPELQDYDDGLTAWSDPRLGFHHSYLVSPPAGSGSDEREV